MTDSIDIEMSDRTGVPWVNQEQLMNTVRYVLRDIGVAEATLTHLITSCEASSIEKDNLAKWKAMLDKMPPYLVNPERSEISARPALRRCKGS